MLTPQEVTNSVFEKAILGGYDTASVDKFMAQLTQDYSALYRENGILKTKMKVLVDKVEDYRSTEDSMRMALLQAEKTAKEIVEAAEAKRDAVESEVEQKKSELMRQAEAEAEERRAEIRQSLATEEAALERARRATAEYLGKLKAAMAEYAETVERVYDFVEPLPPQPEPADAPEEAAPEASAPEEPASEGVSQDTVENIAEIINRAFSSLEEKEKSAEEEPYKEFTSSTIPKIDYNNLQFGENYDPKNKK
ncbi:MAG: DivIVA domain-containing protein [Oscillospiraceae bacterium]|nr:DivIVA domain-containing protein [Oscillospiraceae bacterium]